MYAAIDAATGIPELTYAVDAFTPGALAAVPEAGFGAGLLAGVFGLSWTRRLRRSGDRRFERR